MDECLQVDKVKRTFPAKRGKGSVLAVDGVSFALRPGETLGIIGPSGCGKTTLSHLILGLEKPDEGSIRVKGRIGFVPQDPYASLDPKLNVYRCIAEPLLFLRLQKSWAACENAVRAVMEQVHLDYEGYKGRLPSQLSGGERQRVSIARALVHQPDLLILDEPTSMIDQEVRREIVSLLRSLAVHEQRALLMVTHDIVISVGICERLLVMEQGRVVEEGRTEEILKAPKADLTRRLTLASQDIRAYWDAKSL
jgi:ABC-type glutathione transport system ATPase component